MSNSQLEAESSDGELGGPATPTATRTLTAGGFRITGSQRSVSHIEYECEREDAFGVRLRYVFLIFDTDEPNSIVVDSRSAIARQNGAAVVVVSKTGSSISLSWPDFVAVLGGAVPTWRALSDEFFEVLAGSGRNQEVEGHDEQPWRIYEDAVADAFEFLFGRRARRLGGHRRGSKVPDCVIPSPDAGVLVIDTKSSANCFGVTYDELRPLKEYVTNQRTRQTGAQPVSGAVLVADQFRQDPDRLREQAHEFFSEVSVPLTFLTTDSLSRAVRALATDVRMRNKLRWRRWLCVGGLADDNVFSEELRRARDESVAT